ncbi:MAG TPA: flagellar biosynthetic protein FliO [Rhodopila sp.]|nr:flagellar biosynthetic protein FliO [Rhodopila sp.]
MMMSASDWIAPAVALAALPLIAVALRFQRGRTVSPLRRTTRALIVQETIALDPRRRVHLVACAGKRVVLLTGGPQDLVIGWLSEP